MTLNANCFFKFPANGPITSSPRVVMLKQRRPGDETVPNNEFSFFLVQLMDQCNHSHHLLRIKAQLWLPATGAVNSRACFWIFIAFRFTVGQAKEAEPHHGNFFMPLKNDLASWDR